MKNRSLIWIRNIFLTGIVVLIPLIVTGYILFLLFQMIYQIFDKPVSNFVDQYHEMLPEFIITNDYILTAAAFVITLFLIFLVGLIATNVIVKRMIAYIEKVLSKIPIINIIYPLTKQVANSIKQIGDSKNGFEDKKVVLIPYPDIEGYFIGFQTSQFQGAEGEELVSVFVPTAPNPITGFVTVFKKESVLPSGIDMKTASKLLISGGLIPPDQLNLSQSITNPAK